MQWTWECFLQPIKAGEVTEEDLCQPEILSALANRGMLEARERDLVQVRALLAAGWKYELPDGDPEPMSWYWRAPPKRPGKLGRKYLSTNQAYNAMTRVA